jgi:hypothetical protein
MGIGDRVGRGKGEKLTSEDVVESAAQSILGKIL